MPFDSRAVANYFLTLAERDGETISPMKLQKLVYFAHGWYLAIYDKPLLKDAIEAWDFGPVIPQLYHDFKQFGNGPVTEKATDIVFEESDSRRRSYRIETPEVWEDQLRTFLDVVWEKYKSFSAVQLSNLTHVPDSPWSHVRAANPGKRNVTIPDSDIKAYFDRVS